LAEYIQNVYRHPSRLAERRAKLKGAAVGSTDRIATLVEAVGRGKA
jgi:Trm5-related predicted tRNA methylase